MTVRKANPSDIEKINSVCIEAFMNSVAPTLEEEGIKTFRSIASMDAIEGRMKADNIMLVYESRGQIIGFIELKEGRHLAMLFVIPKYQKSGVGRSLITAILPYVMSNVVTVSASLSSVVAYQSFGFKCVGEASEKSGLKYQPMELLLSDSVSLCV